jgi:hypothetical protein
MYAIWAQDWFAKRVLTVGPLQYYIFSCWAASLGKLDQVAYSVHTLRRLSCPRQAYSRHRADITAPLFSSLPPPPTPNPPSSPSAFLLSTLSCICMHAVTEKIFFQTFCASHHPPSFFAIGPSVHMQTVQKSCIFAVSFCCDFFFVCFLQPMQMASTFSAFLLNFRLLCYPIPNTFLISINVDLFPH